MVEVSYGGGTPRRVTVPAVQEFKAAETLCFWFECLKAILHPGPFLNQTLSIFPVKLNNSPKKKLMEICT